MLVTLEIAKDQLRVSNTASDAIITRYILQVEAAVFQYLELADLADFYVEHGDGHPYILECAVLLGITELYDNRSSNPLTQGVRDLLRRYRPLIVGDADYTG